jgi:Icc-related predicted phosphoesterase
MKILALTDLHAKTAVLTALAEPLKIADVLLISGDITHFGHYAEMERIIVRLHEINPHLFAVAGNCDYPDAEKYLADQNISLNGIKKNYNGYEFAGLSGSLPCPGGKTPNEYFEEEYSSVLNGLELQHENPLIFVSHQPPFGTLNDEVSPGVHAGSKNIRLFIESVQPLICFTGHIHEGIAIDTIGNTSIVNPGPAAAGNYAFVEIEGSAIKSIELRNLFR